MKPILVVGSINVDFVAQAERIPQPGETIAGQCFETHNGGKGANQACAVAKLGHAVTLIGTIGSDVFGEGLRRDLEGAGVNCAAVGRVDGSTGVALIVRAASGENSIVVVSGANAHLTSETILGHRATIRNASLLMLQLETPLGGIVSAAKIAQNSGVPVMLDPAPARPLPSELLRCVTWLTPNESEAGILLGRPSGIVGLAPAESARALLALGPRNVVVKLGSSGAFLAGEGITPVHVPGIAVNAVDTTAAGDTFNAAFALKLIEGATPLDAAHYANFAAAISVTRLGAQSSIPSAAEVLAFAGRTAS